MQIRVHVWYIILTYSTRRSVHVQYIIRTYCTVRTDVAEDMLQYILIRVNTTFAKATTLAKATTRATASAAAAMELMAAVAATRRWLHRPVSESSTDGWSASAQEMRGCACVVVRHLSALFGVPIAEQSQPSPATDTSDSG